MLSISKKSIAPTGMVEVFPMDKMPIFGWVLCNGAYLPKDLYVELYSVIGGLYGENKDSFAVPDYRDIYLKQSNLGVVSAPTIKRHSHTATIPAGGAHQHPYHVAPFASNHSRGDSGSYKPTIIRYYRGKTELGGKHTHKVAVLNDGTKNPVLKSVNTAYYIKI